jgi:hypothetical protein
VLHGCCGAAAAASVEVFDSNQLAVLLTSPQPLGGVLLQLPAAVLASNASNCEAIVSSNYGCYALLVCAVCMQM